MTVRYLASQWRQSAFERAFLENASTPADAPEWLPRPPQTQATSVFLNKGKSVAPGSLQALVSLSRKIVRS